MSDVNHFFGRTCPMPTVGKITTVVQLDIFKKRFNRAHFFALFEQEYRETVHSCTVSVSREPQTRVYLTLLSFQLESKHRIKRLKKARERGEKWVGHNVRPESIWVGHSSNWVGQCPMSDRYFRPSMSTNIKR